MCGTGHHAVEIDLDDFAKDLRLELLAAVADGALAQDHRVQGRGRHSKEPQRRRIRQVELRVVQPAHVGTVEACIIPCALAPSGDANRCAAKPKRMGDAVADAARAADDQNLLPAKVQVPHSASRLIR